MHQTASLQDTGERLIPDLEPNELNRLVHESRYRYAQRYVPDNGTVLDFGSGSGYGLRALSRHTQGACLGIDKPEAVAYARERYGDDGLRFEPGDLCDPACRHGRFSLVVSFDVIEHVEDIDQYLANIAAQLDPETGVALISTPWSSRRDNRWPLHNKHHVEELTLDDFIARLTRHMDIEDLLLTLGAFAVLRPKGTVAREQPMAREQSPDPEHTLDRLVLHTPLGVFRQLERDYERCARALETLEPRHEAEEAIAELLALPGYAAGHRAAPARFRPRRGGARDTRLIGLTQDAELVTEITVDADVLCGIELLPGTYQRLNAGHVEIHVTLLEHVDAEADGPSDANGQPKPQQAAPSSTPTRSATVPAFLALDGRPLSLRFAPIAECAGRRVRIRIRATGAPPNARLGLWCDEDDRPLLRPIHRRLNWRGQGTHIQDATFEARGIEFPTVPLSPDGRQLFAPGMIRRRFRSTWATTALPPVGRRPWDTAAPLPIKIARALRRYGLRATIAEMRPWLAGRKRKGEEPPTG